MSIRRKGGILAALMLILLVAGGCWSRREIDDLLVITAVAVDLAEGNNFRVTAAVARPQKIVQTVGGGGVEPGQGDWVISNTGPNLADAFFGFSSLSTRQLWLGHVRTIIFGEEAARRGIYNHLDFIQREIHLRWSTRVLVTPGLAAKLLEVSHGLEPSSGEALESLTRLTAQASVAETPTVAHFLLEARRQGIDSVAAVLLPIMPPQSAEDGGGGEQQPVGFRIEGNGVFKEDRLVGWLDSLETRGLLLATGRVERGVITIPCPGAPPESGTLALVVIRSWGEAKTEQSPAGMELTVEARLTTKIVEAACPSDLEEPEMMTQVKHLLEETAGKEVEATLREARELKADIFGFGAALRRTQPETWRRLAAGWSEEWPLLPTSINITARVIATEMVSSPIRVHQEGD